MTTAQKKRRANSRAGAEPCAAEAQAETEGGPKGPHPDPLPHALGVAPPRLTRQRGPKVPARAGEGEGAAPEIAAPAKAPAKKRVYPPKNRPRVDAETLRLRALRGNDPPAVEAPAADASHLPAARGRVIGRPVRAPAQGAPKDPQEDRIALYAPYAKQRAFHNDGAAHRERLFMAGNQLGKTTAGAMEAALHATGLYPEWWQGRRFDRPTTGWVAGITAETTRDTVQRLLLGRPRGENKGVIPDRLIEKVSNSYTIAGVTDTIMIRHVSGGLSVLAFKSYEKGRAKWQGESLDYVWFDEEPPQDVYSEGLTRISATGGSVFMTFTPLLGMSEVVRRFLADASPDRAVTRMTIDDAGHIAEGERARIVAGYPEHEREARAQGMPQLGSGRIFPVPVADIAVENFTIPKHWPLIGGLDFGWDHPTAAVRLAWDRDADCLYVTHCYRQAEETPVVHAAVLRQWGAGLGWAWPADGLAHDKGSGVRLAELYRARGLHLLSRHATFEDGSVGVEAGVMEMLERMQSGRWKVFRGCTEWFDEFRLYHRKDGRIVKEADDLISAARYAMMMRRYAKTEVNESWSKPIKYDSRWIV